MTAKAASPETRDRIRREEVSPGYRWWLHVAVLVITWAATCAICIWQLQRVELRHWTFLALGILISYVVEYVAHRWPFHHPWGGMAYHRHTLVHHHFFTYERAVIDSKRDLVLVLLPWWIWFAFAAVLAPMVAPFVLWGDPNFGWMIPLGVGVYYPLYEIAHLVSHLSFADAPGWRGLTLHHRLHHKPANWGKNLSFCVPFLDMVLGTQVKSELE